MERQIYYGLRITYLFVGRTFLYHFELLLLQKAEAVAQFSNLFFSKVPAWRIATLFKQKLRHKCFL